MTVLDHVQAVLQPILVDYAAYIIIGGMAWFFRRLPDKWRLEIESRHREALHRALNTGVGLAIDMAQKHPSVLVADVAATRVVEYVKASVPDAIKRLGPSHQHLEDMARAKITEKIDAIAGRDRLSEALDRAGVDGVVKQP